MSYIHIPHERPLDHRTAFQLLQTHANKQPNKEAIVFRDEKLNRVSLTFQEYDTKSSSLAAGLLEIGIGRGDRVLVLLPSYVEFVLFHMALNRIGAVMIAVEECVYPAVCGTRQLACVIARVEPSVTDNDKVISEIKKALHQDKLKAAVLVGSDADIEIIDHSKAYSHHDLYAVANRNPDSVANVRNAEAKVQMDDPCLVLFTSGSTSLPKPIEYTHHAYVNGFCSATEHLKLTTDSVYFTDMPFDWISGINFSIGPCIDQGLTYISLPAKIAICGKHMMTIMKILQQECVTHAVFLLYLLQDIALHDEEIQAMNLTSFQYVITGGQPTPLPLINKILQLWPTVEFINTCGSTEASFIFRQIISNDNLDSLDYGVMEVIPGMEVKIVDEQGRLLPIGIAGEICLRSSWVSFCNWDYMDPELEGREHTKTNPNGWHFTNDVGVVVNGNCIRLLGRLDFMIKVAAESIPPALVESTLQEHPDVKKVCVVGVPDDRLYQKICACIILKESHHDNKAVLSNQLDQWGKDKFLESSIGFIVKPHYYVFLDSFPLTRTGKLNRREVRDIAIKELGLVK